MTYYHHSLAAAVTRELAAAYTALDNCRQLLALFDDRPLVVPCRTAEHPAGVHETKILAAKYPAGLEEVASHTSGHDGANSSPQCGQSQQIAICRVAEHPAEVHEHFVAEAHHVEGPECPITEPRHREVWHWLEDR